MKIKNRSDLPSNKKFGLTFSLIFLLFAFYFYSYESSYFYILSLSFAFIFFISSLFLPDVLLLPNKLWSDLGKLLHKITNPLLLGLIFLFLITPIAWLLRAAGRDLLHMKRPSNTSTFWINRPKDKKISFSDQF